MAKKPKANRAPKVELQGVKDVSGTDLPKVEIPAAAKGRVPEQGLVPGKPVTRNGATDNSDKAVYGNSLRETITATDIATKHSDAERPPTGLTLEQRLAQITPEPPESDLSLAPTERKVALHEDLPVWPVSPQRQELAAKSATKLDTPVVESIPTASPVGRFKTDPLLEILPADIGFVPGHLYLFAFNLGQYSVQDITRWVDRNVEWDAEVDPKIFYFNGTTERATVRMYREQAIKDRVPAIAIVALPPHCFQMEPIHVLHANEADAAFAIDALSVTRVKLRSVKDAPEVRSVPFA